MSKKLRDAFGGGSPHLRISTARQPWSGSGLISYVRVVVKIRDPFWVP